VIALGNPFGLGGSITKGILSSKNRRPRAGNEPLGFQDWLQTDAAINPGNSGGPLVNLKGELIGLNVAVYREEDGERGMGVGFSIPVKQVSAALGRFFTPEVTHAAWFGARFKSGGANLALIEIQPGSPAAKAGLKEGDQIAEVNGQRPRGLVAFARSIGGAGSHEVRLIILRGAERKNVVVRMVPFDELIRQKLGMSLAEVTDESAQRLGIKTGEGMVVQEVEKNSPAERAQFQRGYVVTQVDGQPAGEIRTVGEILSGKQKGQSVTLAVAVPRRVGGNYIEFRQGTVELEVK
jgi:S1-C subfamily serine protease